jgi:hypothetical protein
MEATIGFDLRLTAPDPSWTADRRALHLPRRDVPLVRSVDAGVWERPPGLPPSPEVGGLWPDLPDLLAAADYYLMSGLANCGYWSDEAASLASAWVPLLNEWHLFGKPEDAAAYAEVTDRPVPE